jgi:hypothetical protein
VFEKTAEELKVEFEFQPGDIQLVSNHSLLHTRTEYEDHEVGHPWAGVAAAHGAGSIVLSKVGLSVKALASQPNTPTWASLRRMHGRRPAL